MVVYREAKPYEFEECEKTFSNESNCKRHKTSHNDEIHSVCVECNTIYNYSSHVLKTIISSK